MSIRINTGDYLSTPMGIHMGLNRCSHDCFYCFANLNDPDRKASYNQIQKLISNVAIGDPNIRHLPTNLAMAGHPVLVSGDSDPFAESNQPHFGAIREALNHLGVNIVYNTKGGTAANLILSHVQPTMVQISFTSDKADVLERTEPNAPDHSSRMDLALSAQAAGHHVIIGLNGFYGDWWDDFAGFADWIVRHGFHYVCFSELRLNSAQKANIPQTAQHQFASIIDASCILKRHNPQAEAALRILTERGINVFTGTTSTRGNFWDPYFDLGFPFYPTLDEFFTQLRGMGQRVAFSFDVFNDFADPHPELVETSSFKQYLYGIGRSMRKAEYSDKVYNYKDVHEILWLIDKFPSKLRHDDIFLLKDGHDLMTDDKGRLMLAYVPGIKDPTLGRWDVQDCDAILMAE